jgi:predicted amidohydrolase
MKIGLVQMVCEKGALQRNLDITARYIEEAADLGVDILAFPEASLSGYANPNLYPHAVISLENPLVSDLLALTLGKSLSVLAGLLEENLTGKPFISHVVVRDGVLAGWQHKMTLGEQQDGQLEDWYEVGDTVNVFHHASITFGIAICADLGNASVFADCARQGAQVVFELAAPGLYGEQATRDWTSGFRWWDGEILKYMSQYTLKHHYWGAVATQSGRTSDEDFPGGAYIFAPNGKRVYATPDGTPGAVYIEIDLNTGRVVQLI